MNYFNAVLRPPNELEEALTSFAQENFADKADGYCLSDKVFPHITLCQFKANAMPEISFDEIKKSPDPVKYNVGVGTGIHEGYVWAEILIKPEPWLYHLHEYVKNKLSSYDVEILTKNYMPHQTFCRLPANQQDFAQSIKLPKMFLKQYEGWTFEVGHSDGNGQYLGKDS